MEKDYNDYIIVKDAAEKLGVTPQNMYKHIREKHIETEEILDRLCIHRDELQKFVWSKHYRGKEGEQK